MPKQPINVRLDTDLIAATDAFAASTGTNRTELIDRGLRQLLAPRGVAPRGASLPHPDDVRVLDPEPMRRVRTTEVRRHLPTCKCGVCAPEPRPKGATKR